MKDRIITISLPYPWVLLVCIQPTTDGKYWKKTNSRKQNLGLLHTDNYLHYTYNYLHGIYIV